MPETPVPPEAVEAAAKAIADRELAGSSLDRMAGAPKSRRRTMALAALEAAAPHILAAAADARWQALKDWLAAEIGHDHSVMESYRDYPDDGLTSRAHGALVSAHRSALAKMRELEQ